MNKEKQATSTVVAKINNVEIVVVENGNKLVPMKPICEALGVDFSGQLQKLKNDPILGSTVELSSIVAADGKAREMASIPFMWIFGWLLTIDSRNVKEEAREAIVKYQIECYMALYNHFTRYAEFVEWQSALIEEQIVIVDAINYNFHEAKNQLAEAKIEFNRRRRLTIDDYMAEKAQLKLNFQEA